MNETKHNLRCKSELKRLVTVTPMDLVELMHAVVLERDALRAQVTCLEKDVERFQADALCSVCAGTGTPVSGDPCICGGSGTVTHEAQGLREALVVKEMSKHSEDHCDACGDRQVFVQYYRKQKKTLCTHCYFDIVIKQENVSLWAENKALKEELTQRDNS